MRYSSVRFGEVRIPNHCTTHSEGDQVGNTVGLLPVQYESPEQISIPVVTNSPAGLPHAMLYVMTLAPHEAAGSYELKACRLWEEQSQEGFVPFLYDGVIPSGPGIDFLDAIRNPVIVSIIDADGNIREGEGVIPPPTQR